MEYYQLCALFISTATNLPPNNFYLNLFSLSTTSHPVSDSMMAYTDNRRTYNDYLKTQGHSRQQNKTVAAFRKSVTLGKK